MTTCGPLHLEPVVLLTNVMESDAIECSSGDSSNSENQTSNFFEVEQTEPLNLCLTSVSSGYGTPEVCSNPDSTDLSDDDVVFVQEYSMRKSKTLRRCLKTRHTQQEKIRRNPVRRARDNKRFKDFTNISFDDDDENNEETDENSTCNSEDFYTKDKDNEDWKIESAPKRGRYRRRVFNRRFCGRKKKITNIMEKKVDLYDLESIFEDNLSLIRSHIIDVKYLNEKFPNGNIMKQTVAERISNTVALFKQQLILSTIAKGSDVGLAKLLTE